MRSVNLLLLLVVGIAGLITACTFPETSPSVTSTLDSAPSVNAGEVDADRLSRDAAGLIVLDGVPFTGTRLAHKTGALVERSAYVSGLRHGLTERWHPDGTLGYRATYLEGRRNGTVETWWPNGIRHSKSHYVQGTADGVQREWYRSGTLFKELHLVKGREEGLQRAWRENGALYTNYEARDGRIYGLKRANLCYELDDEKLVTN